MIILPAIDLIGGKAVRLFKGDYSKMTVYSDHPEEVAENFRECGAEWIHIVDLEGAKSGLTPNIDTIRSIIGSCAMSGVSRVVLGTAAVNDPGFVKDAVIHFGPMISVGVDIKEGYVAIKGWTEKSAYTALDFCRMMQDIGVRTIICTDISKDGAMKGTNLELYRQLSSELELDLVASGGVSSMDDVRALAASGIYGAIIGKAYYTGAIDLREAVAAAKGDGEAL